MHSLEDFQAEMRLDRELGRFFWLKGGRGRLPSLEVGSFDVHGYGQVNFKRKLYKEHRLVWLFVTGEWPNGQLDHINHDRRDNRFENLRVVSNQENHFNRPLQKNNKSGVPGVWFDKAVGRYRVFINVGGKRHELGYHADKDEAIKVRMAANEKYEFHENHGIGTGRPKYKRYGKDAERYARSEGKS